MKDDMKKAVDVIVRRADILTQDEWIDLEDNTDLGLLVAWIREVSALLKMLVEESNDK